MQGCRSNRLEEPVCEGGFPVDEIVGVEDYSADRWSANLKGKIRVSCSDSPIKVLTGFPCGSVSLTLISDV